MSDTLSSPLFVVGSSVSCRQYDLSRLSPLTSGGGQLQRRQDLPERAFYFPADDELGSCQTGIRSFTSLHCPTGGFPRVHVGVVESCVSTVEQPVFFIRLTRVT